MKELNIRHSVRGNAAIWHLGAIFLGLLATALFILAVGVYYGYIGGSVVGSLTDGELGVFGFLAAAGAVACEIAASRRGRD
ncbi:MAG: hypothetical protein WBF81_05985 [Thermoplasmata archaeon]